MSGFDKTILVTGGCGFIGSAYLRHMVPLFPQRRFVCIDNFSNGVYENISHLALEQNFFFEECDLTSFCHLEEVWCKYMPDMVVNFAAQHHVDVSISKPAYTIENNISLTTNLLECSRKYPLKLFHHISTDEVYGDVDITSPLSYDETDSLFPRSPYSASKAMCELMLHAYAHTYETPVLITRSGNNYGICQMESTIIPRAIRIFLDQKHGIDTRFPLHGSGDNVRNYIFVMDHIVILERLQAYYEHHSIAYECYNIESRESFSNISLLGILHQMITPDIPLEKIIVSVPDRRGNDRKYSMNCEKIRLLLGDIVYTDFYDSLSEIIAWHENRSHYL